ncbi:N-methyl-L-tryptophan oxidase [Cellulomonas triticagri]|uniref:N-methyl-L-tryptophan oxidase n=1 Tax=Cellulomonas triticagri TaxID=2483352 RepID=UPI0013153B7F|nr:N-methyl-L-tryptophan oxidase [Cellulomonas triticagri]
MSGTYSHVVIGAGAIGSAASYWLTRRGAERVLLLEQHDLGHALGSSGDHSRIIRRSYHRAEYARLTDAMFEAWEQVERASGLPVYTRTGGLDLAPPEHGGDARLDVFRAAMDAAGHTYQDLTTDDLRARYPQWRVPDGTAALFQADAGIIDIRRSVSAHTALALAAGVELRTRTRVTGLDVRDSSVTVRTTGGDVEAGALVVATASWLPELMGDLGLDFRLTLSEEQVDYVAARHLPSFTPDRFPIWVYHGADVHYGFPVYGEAAVKIARDMRGRFVTVDGRTHQPDPEETARSLRFLAEHLPDAAGAPLVARTCVYDMPADREFVLDTVPGHPHVAVANGAGHAGKFASLLGSVLADLLTAGTTTHDIDLFSLDRPAITDPRFPTEFSLHA